MRIARLAATAAVCALLVTACASEDDPSAEQVGPTAAASETAEVVETPSATPSAIPSATPPAATPSAGTPAASATPDVVEIEIEIEDGEVQTASDRVRVAKGEQVRIEAESDVADSIHLHGYDIEEPIGPGESGVMAFTADQVGVFELETHESGLLLLQLEVR